MIPSIVCSVLIDRHTGTIDFSILEVRINPGDNKGKENMNFRQRRRRPVRRHVRGIYNRRLHGLTSIPRSGNARSASSPSSRSARRETNSGWAASEIHSPTIIFGDQHHPDTASVLRERARIEILLSGCQVLLDAFRNRRTCNRIGLDLRHQGSTQRFRLLQIRKTGTLPWD